MRRCGEEAWRSWGSASLRDSVSYPLTAGLLIPCRLITLLQKYAHIIGMLFLARARCMVRRVSAPLTPPPPSSPETSPRPVHRAIGPELDIVEAGSLLDTDPDLAPWSELGR